MKNVLYTIALILTASTVSAHEIGTDHLHVGDTQSDVNVTIETDVHVHTHRTGRVVNSRPVHRHGHHHCRIVRDYVPNHGFTSVRKCDKPRHHRTHWVLTIVSDGIYYEVTSRNKVRIGASYRLSN
jgi:hypothetical protein